MTRLFFYTLTLIISTSCFSQKSTTVGHKIIGDFNGDNRIDTTRITIKNNPTANKYLVSFSDKTIPSILLNCCDVVLVNEGDLNSDQKTDISIFQEPENGCVYTWTTYSLKDNYWTQIVRPFLINTDCENLSPIDLEKKVFNENGQIYYWDTDPNDENNKPIKKRVVPK